MEEKIAAVIFDMDGVIVDSETFLIKEYKNYIESIGKVLTKEDEVAFNGCSDALEIEILSHYLDLDHDGIVKFIKDFNKLHPFPYKDIVIYGVVDLIKYLKSKGLKLAIASSSKKEHILKMVNDCNLSDYFDLLVSGSEFKNSKPDPEIYLSTAKKLGVEKENIIIIEDSKYGLMAANNAKIKCILLENKSLFDRTSAIVTCKSHLDILSYFEKIL